MSGTATCWCNLRPGTLILSRSGNCKAEHQISALTQASMSHQPVPPACQPLTQHLARAAPKAKHVLSLQWFHKHSTVSLSCSEGKAILSPPPQAPWGTPDARSLQTAPYGFPVHNMTESMVFLCLCFCDMQHHARLGDDHSDDWLWAPTQFCYLWKVPTPLPFPTFPRGRSRGRGGYCNFQQLVPPWGLTFQSPTATPRAQLLGSHRSIKKELNILPKMTDKEKLRLEPTLVMTIPSFLLLNYAMRWNLICARRGKERKGNESWKGKIGNKLLTWWHLNCLKG